MANTNTLQKELTGNTARVYDEYQLAKARYARDVEDNGIDYAQANLATAKDVYTQSFSKYSAFQQRSQFEALANAAIETAARDILAGK